MKRGGLSFAEILLGTLVLALALLPLYSMMVEDSKAAVSSRLAYLSGQLAREIMEEALLVPPPRLEVWVRAINEGSDFRRVKGKLFRTTAEALDDPGGGSSPDDRLAGPPATPDYPAGYDRFKVKASLEETWSPKLKKLVLDVQWEEHAGQGEKSRPALTRFETLVGAHSPDPTVPAVP